MKNVINILNNHNLQIVKNVTYYVKEYECKRCKEKFTTSIRGNITYLTKERKEINSILGKIHLKKLQKKSLYNSIDFK